MNFIKYLESSEEKVIKISQQYYHYRLILSSFVANLEKYSLQELSGNLEGYRETLYSLSKLELEASRFGWKFSYLDANADKLKEEYLAALSLAEKLSGDFPS